MLILYQIHRLYSHFLWYRFWGAGQEDSAWIVNPKDFNDPYDSIASVDVCAIRNQVVKDNLENIIKGKDIPDEIVCKAKVNSDPLAVLYSYFTKDLRPDIQNKIKMVLDEFQSLLDDRTWGYFNNATIDSLRICSFGGNNNCLLMWSHYADCHQGFCVEYDLSKFPPDDYRRRFMFPVIYSDKFIDVTEHYKSENNLYPVLMAMHKCKTWSYEKEWRLIFPGGIMENNNTCNIGRPKAIYLGTRISPENTKKILEIAAKKHVEVFKMYLRKDRFELVPRQIRYH